MTEMDHERLMITLRRAAARLTDNRSVRDIETLMDTLVQAAVDTVSGADGGGLSRTERGTVRSSHATSAVVHDLDELQSRLGQGPCITAADDPPEAGIVLAHDLGGTHDRDRWPRFAPGAVHAGYRSIMSIGLSVEHGRRSALNLYSHRPHVYDTSAQLTGGLFGLQAAMLLHGADHANSLGHALESRDVIGQAKGLLMERFTISQDAAFQMLVASSQDTNIKLVEVARWVISDTDTQRELAAES